MVVGLSAIAAFAGSGQVSKAVLMTVLGLIMATVGEGALFNLPPFHNGHYGLTIRFWVCHTSNGYVRTARSNIFDIKTAVS